MQAATEALKEVPRKAQVLMQRAYAYQKLARPALAAQDFAAALKEEGCPPPRRAMPASRWRMRILPPSNPRRRSTRSPRSGAN